MGRRRTRPREHADGQVRSAKARDGAGQDARGDEGQNSRADPAHQQTVNRRHKSDRQTAPIGLTTAGLVVARAARHASLAAAAVMLHPL